jgi:hypothetical protein
MNRSAIAKIITGWGMNKSQGNHACKAKVDLTRKGR